MTSSGKKLFNPRIFTKLFPREFKRLLPVVYIYLLILGLILTLVYAFVPEFVICSGIFGQQFCTPAGIFTALFASLPGYLFAGNFLTFISALPWFISFIVIIVVSGIFYYLIGYIIDAQRGQKFTSEKLVKTIIILAFILLTLFLLALLPSR